MTDRWRRLVPAALIVALGAAVALAPRDAPSMATADPTGPAGLYAALSDEGRSRVLVAFDPDLGTYAEIRPAVRAALAQLVRGGGNLSFASFTAEGRAVALAELDRLRRGGVEGGRLLDLGFHAGAEAGLVAGVDRIVADEAAGALAEALRAAGGGIGAFDLVLVVGGSELGPRSWVEQVGTRLPDLPLTAIVPTILQPQTIPYRVSGQLDALVAGVREGAAYVASVRDDATTAAREAERVTDLPPSSLPLLAAMLATILLLAEAVATRWRGSREGTT